MLMQLEIPIKTVEYVANIAFQHGIRVILNPAPACILSNELLKCIDILIPNETEAEILSGIKVTDWESAKKAANIISLKGVKNVVITLGSLGALIKENDQYYEVNAYKVNAIDTTAAGDTFCGALCVGLSENMTLLESVQLANKASALTVTRLGAQSSIPYRKELSIINNVAIDHF
jgi:ribokinase